MTAVLISGVTLIAAGMFLLGAYCHRAAENALRWLLVRLMPADGAHRVPASDVEQSFTREPITTPLLAAQASDTTIAHADAMWQCSEPYLPESPPPYFPARVPVEQPRGRHARRLPLTEQVIPVPRIGTQPWETAPFAAVPDGPAPSDPGDGLTEVDLVRPYAPPTDEETRDLYFAPASSFPCCRHCDDGVCEPHHVACMDCQPGYGTDRCEADVLAAEDGAQMAEVYLP